MSSVPVIQTKVSPKVIVAGIVSFLAPAALASLLFLQTSEGSVIFDSLHPILKVFVLALVASAVTAISAYLKRDPLREIGQQAKESIPIPELDEPFSEPLPESGVVDENGDGRDDNTGRFVSGT